MSFLGKPANLHSQLKSCSVAWLWSGEVWPIVLQKDFRLSLI